MVHHKNITKGDTFYFGITCENHDCAFQVRVILSAELMLEDGVEFQTYLYKEDARIFKFTIP